MLSGAPLRKVRFYQWDEPLVQVSADRYWIGLRDRDDGKKGKWIIVGEEYETWPAPDRMVLACGHLCDFPRDRDTIYFNRSKRCLFCAMEAAA